METNEIRHTINTEQQINEDYKKIMLGLEAEIEKMNLKVGGKFKITYGGKELELKLELFPHPTVGEASGYIKNILASRESGSTTFLYRIAKEVMQKIVNKTNTKIIYILSTSNPNMKAWAETKGREIFSWEKYEDHPEQLFRFNFITTIFPENNENNV